ncbi:hypothetical protein LQW54_001866 [Pestalotiopsis sp. IQ-011]
MLIKITGMTVTGTRVPTHSSQTWQMRDLPVGAFGGDGWRKQLGDQRHHLHLAIPFAQQPGPLLHVNVETCLEKDKWDGAWNCIEGSPHGGSHGGGVMLNVANSPGDPLFFLHHAFIDLLWWRWQSADLDARLAEVGGVKAQSQLSCDRQGLRCAGASILDYDGDDGNQTTLNHVLWMMDLSPNVTVADVMNINSTSVCLEYI